MLNVYRISLITMGVLFSLFLSIAVNATTIGERGNASFMCDRASLHEFSEAASIGMDEAMAVYNDKVESGTCAGFYPPVPAQIVKRDGAFVDFAGSKFVVYEIDVPQDVDDMIGFTPYIWIKR